VDGRVAWRRRGGDVAGGPRVRLAGGRLQVSGLTAGRRHLLLARS
jgi:hypothetical protein